MFTTPPLPPGGAVLRFGRSIPFSGFGFSDGSVKCRTASCASVLFDTAGQLLHESWHRIDRAITDSNEAEFQAILDTIAEAQHQGFKALWLGTDSFQVIEHTLKGSTRYGPYIEALHRLRGAFDYLEIQAIDRTRNKRADALARCGTRDVH